MLIRTALAVSVVTACVPAQVEHLEIRSREVVADGASFGDVGPYEVIRGELRFALDPGAAANARIVDLDLAPRNADGRVESVADLVVLQPVDAAKRRGTALVEVSNRGGMATLFHFQRASTGDFAKPEAFGDGLLMRMGMTVVWCGWQFDVPDRPGTLRLRVPIAKHPDGTSIEGPVRSDHVAFEPARRIELGHRGHRPYPVVRPTSDEHRLTRRTGRDAERVEVPRTAWRFTADLRAIEPVGASVFDAGFIYELVYVAKDPAIVGMGLAAIRDVAGWLVHDPDCPFGVDRTVAVGISQTGRFLRQFVWQGFTTDVDGRPVLDGILALTAGAGRGSFNHRFAQPSRDAHRLSAFAYPTDVFPFTSAVQEDPVSGRRDGLVDPGHTSHVPRIFQVNTGYEYFGRAAALIHTDVAGTADVDAPADRERIYHVAGAQHYPTDPSRGSPIALRAYNRASLVALLDWVERGVEPPPSTHPRIDDGTLVPPAGRPDAGIPGVIVPRAIQTAHRVDYGPRFWSDGIVTTTPPTFGPAFPSLVPTVDGYGNELGGMRGLELRVPVATYLPYRVLPEDRAFAGEIADFVGTFVPFPTSQDADDPRPTPFELHGDRDGYLERCRRALDALIEERWVLAEDRERMLEHAAALWDAAVD